jgi:hypothetical protein
MLLIGSIRRSIMIKWGGGSMMACALPSLGRMLKVCLREDDRRMMRPPAPLSPVQAVVRANFWRAGQDDSDEAHAEPLHLY